jgi:hypothetical protein
VATANVDAVGGDVTLLSNLAPLLPNPRPIRCCGEEGEEEDDDAVGEDLGRGGGGDMILLFDDKEDFAESLVSLFLKLLDGELFPPPPCSML